MSEPTPVKPIVVRQGDAVLLQAPGPGWLKLEPETVDAIAAHATAPQLAELPDELCDWLHLVAEFHRLNHWDLGLTILLGVTYDPGSVAAYVGASSTSEELKRGIQLINEDGELCDSTLLVEALEVSLRRDLPAAGSGG